MSEAKHTPGPWGIEEHSESTPLRQISDRPTVAHVGDWRVVRDGRGSRGYDLHGEDEADARLIAAAPDLLDALKAVDAVGIINPTGSRKVESAVTKMRAAIAKAEGRP